ncbi:hypothetical protein AB5J55_00220 [Streptomyces sp. R11]|uniref:Uncharacterized protein n=1 Tax=Streptomyces sp. R11 TaxID=3238625 RepID=A0AB39MQZ3_9ACTN
MTHPSKARRSSVHLPRLTTARALAQRPLDAPEGLSRPQPPS